MMSFLANPTSPCGNVGPPSKAAISLPPFADRRQSTWLGKSIPSYKGVFDLMIPGRQLGFETLGSQCCCTSTVVPIPFRLRYSVRRNAGVIHRRLHTLPRITCLALREAPVRWAAPPNCVMPDQSRRIAGSCHGPLSAKKVSGREAGGWLSLNKLSRTNAIRRHGKSLWPGVGRRLNGPCCARLDPSFVRVLSHLDSSSPAVGATATLTSYSWNRYCVLALAFPSKD